MKTKTMSKLIEDTLNIVNEINRNNKLVALSYFEENVAMMVKWEKDIILENIKDHIFEKDFKKILEKAI